VNGSAIVNGNLTVNGTTTTINSNTISIDDKTIELAAVVTTTFACTVQNNSTTISGVTPVSGLIPGMVVSSISAGISVPAGTVINSITGNTVVLSNVVTGSTGTASFEAVGPSDTAANGGGLVLKGTVDKTILYDNTRTDKYWVFTENLELALNKKFVIGNQLVLNTTTLGPTVVSSSLTTVGTLSGLTVSGNATFDTNTLFVDAGNDKVGVGVSSGLTGTLTVLNPPANVNANTIAGLGLDVQAPWMRIGDANSGGNTGGRTFTNGVGIKFHDEAVAHYSIGINSNNFVIANTSALGDQLFPSGFTPGITLTTAGNVGIGNNPTTKLDVNGSIKASQYGTLGNFSAQLGQIRVGGDDFGNVIRVVNDTNMNIIANNNIFFNTGAATNGSNYGSNVAYFGTNGLYLPSGKGIDFSANANASGMTSELLDDYETGTWTPGVSFNNGSTGITYSAQNGLYTKVGRKVTVTGYLSLTNKGSSTGTARITGLPFTVANNGGAYSFNSMYFSDINPSENYVGANSFSGGSQWFSTGYFGVDKSKVLDSGEYYNYVRFRRVQTSAYAWCLLFVTKSGNTYTVTFSALINVAAGGFVGEEIVIPLHCGSGGAPSAGHTHGVQLMHGSPIISGTTYLGWLSGNGGAYNPSPSGAIFVTTTEANAGGSGQIDYVQTNTAPTEGQTYTVTNTNTGLDIHIGVFKDYIGGSQFSTMNLGGYPDLGNTTIVLIAQKSFKGSDSFNNRLFKNTTQIGPFSFSYFV